MQQVADDRFRFDLFVDPALTGGTPGRFADVELFGLRLQISFVLAERAFLRRGPFRERLLLGAEFVALRLEELPHLVEFATLLGQSLAQTAVVPGELLLSLIEPLLSDVHAAGLRHLRPSLFNGHAHFERRAVRFFQFGSQFVEPFAAAFEVVRVQGEHVLLASQVGELASPFAFPIVPFAFDLFAVVFGELLESALRFEEHLSLAIDGAFAFFQQRSDAIELRLPQSNDRVPFFQLSACPL